MVEVVIRAMATDGVQVLLQRLEEEFKHQSCVFSAVLLRPPPLPGPGDGTGCGVGVTPFSMLLLKFFFSLFFFFVFFFYFIYLLKIQFI